MRQRIIRLLAATLLGVAAGAVVSAGPAAAAACAKGEGVSVVVGSNVRCDANGGGPARVNFTGTGHSLTYVNGSSFVCKVDGAPSSAGCARTPPADAYWGLFWSDGTSGKWSYASEGVGSLNVPKGGWVAFVFQTSTSKVYPGVTPIGPAPVKPKPKPTTTKPKPVPSATGSASSTPTPTPTASTPTPTTSSETPKPTAAPSSASAPTAAPDASDEQVENASSTSEGSGSLAWVAGGLGLLLLAGMGFAVWQRRVRGGRQS